MDYATNLLAATDVRVRLWCERYRQPGGFRDSLKLSSSECTAVTHIIRAVCVCDAVNILLLLLI